MLKNIIHKILEDQYIHIIYRYKNGKFFVYMPNSYQSRAEKTISMFYSALVKKKFTVNKNYHLKIDVNDFPVHDNKKCFSYCGCTGNESYIIPDFNFINWKESGIDDYDLMTKEILERGKFEYKYDKLFWIGNVNTHPSRRNLIDLMNIDSRIDARKISWNSNGNKPEDYVSLADHTDFKYLIDIQGRGYSGRLKYLLFSNRPLFIVDRKWEEFFFQYLEPYKHYIPVKEDLSDLIEKLDWADNHPVECGIIAKNAVDFACNNLTREKAIEYFGNLVFEYINNVI